MDLTVLCFRILCKNKSETYHMEDFRSIWAAVYQFWAHLIWAPKLGRPEKKRFVKMNIGI